MGKASRDKGKRYERELARLYRANGASVSRNSNQAHPNAVDEDPHGDLLGVQAGPERIHVQAKFQEKLNIWSALHQAEADAPEGHIPVVHFRRSRTANYVALPLGEWLRLLRLLERGAVDG